MSATPRTNRNARIATAFVLVALVLAMPTVGADHGEDHDEQPIEYAGCITIDPFVWPPAVTINPMHCIGG